MGVPEVCEMAGQASQPSEASTGPDDRAPDTRPTHHLPVPGPA